MKYIFLLLPFAFFSCTSDGSSSSDGVDYKTISEEICKCSQPSIVLNDEMVQLQKENKKSELMSLMPKAGETFDKTLECVNNYLFLKSLTKLDEQSLKKNLMDNCSNAPKRLINEIALKVASDKVDNN